MTKAYQRQANWQFSFMAWQSWWDSEMTLDNERPGVVSKHNWWVIHAIRNTMSNRTVPLCFNNPTLPPPAGTILELMGILRPAHTQPCHLMRKLLHHVAAMQKMVGSRQAADQKWYKPNYEKLSNDNRQLLNTKIFSWFQPLLPPLQTETLNLVGDLRIESSWNVQKYRTRYCKRHSVSSYCFRNELRTRSLRTCSWPQWWGKWWQYLRNKLHDAYGRAHYPFYARCFLAPRWQRCRRNRPAHEKHYFCQRSRKCTCQ